MMGGEEYFAVGVVSPFVAASIHGSLYFVERCHITRVNAPVH